MSKKIRFPGRLRAELLLAAILSTLLALATYQVSYLLVNRVIDILSVNESFMENMAKAEIDKLQERIDEEQVAAGDNRTLYDFQSAESVSFEIYDAGTGQMSYYYGYEDDLTLDVKTDATDLSEIRESADAQDEITFKAGEKREIFMHYDKIYNTYGLIIGISLALAALVFLILFLLLIQRKIQYIKQIANDLKILEGGNLEYTITVKGRDELAELADGINSMRKSVLDREMEERKNVKSNRDLVTALSHDIRTPMTSLIGYLEILSMKRYGNEELREKYLESARQKAFQLKEMTDTLFEYSLVSGKTEETYDIEDMPVEELLMAMTDTQIADLASDGWKVDTRFGAAEGACYIRVDIDFYRRVLDNLVSNIRKYADKREKIIIESRIKNNCLYLSLKNRVLHGEPLEGSTGVGLKTSQKILESMEGHLEIERTENIYSITIVQPIYHAEAGNRPLTGE